MELKQYLGLYVILAVCAVFLIGNSADGDAKTRSVLGLCVFWPLTITFFTLKGLYYAAIGTFEVFTGKEKIWKD